MCKQTYSHLIIKIQKQCTHSEIIHCYDFFFFFLVSTQQWYVYMINHGELVQNENGELKAYFECVDRVLIIWGELIIW
jgi:hypothetical protein